tara:strand:+ start:177 stop:386 length:210 start_codon:yes stop_codon:yes gene_type:complete
MDDKENVPTVVELVKYLKEGTLPDEKVFKYQSATGVHLIHIDELRKEAALSLIYSGVHKDTLIGAKTRK